MIFGRLDHAWCALITARLDAIDIMRRHGRYAEYADALARIEVCRLEWLASQ